MAHGGEGRFDRVGGAQMRPVLGREVVEGEQHAPVVGQFLGGLGILRAVVFDEAIERSRRAMEGAKRRAEEPEAGTGRRAKREALRAIESLWGLCEARRAERGGRRTPGASRSGAQGQ